jgi:hypothetical protein
MPRSVWQVLYGREEAHFPTHYPETVAVQRLAGRVERWPRSWASFTREHVVGRVSRERVFLQRYPAWEASPPSPAGLKPGTARWRW